MSLKSSGIFAWMASVRSSMADDPAQQLFDEQVKSHGFLFLEEYLDGIRIGCSQENAIVDLVKTPGRKRTSPVKKSRSVFTTASTWAMSTCAHSENVDSANKVQKTTLFAREFTEQNKAKNSSTSHHTSTQPEISHRTEEEESFHIIEVCSSPPPMTTQYSSDGQDVMMCQTKVTHTGLTHLSLITEVDEVSQSMSQHPVLRTSVHNSPISTKPSSSYSANNLTLITADTDGYEGCIQPKSDITRQHVPNMDVQTDFAQPSDANASTHDPNTDIGRVLKHNAPRFPSIPHPSPLHKPTRNGSGESFPPSTVVSIPSKVADTGKRTSWLTKAREARDAKVGETTAKHHVPAPGSGNLGHLVSTQTNSLKRKSDDLVIDALYIPPTLAADEERRAKHLKINHVNTTNDMDLDPPSSHMVATLPLTSALNSNQTEHIDALDTLRKTVEGLGTKGVKVSAKSTMGAASVAAELARARAAAEARVAERDCDESASPPVLHTARTGHSTTHTVIDHQRLAAICENRDNNDMKPIKDDKKSEGSDSVIFTNGPSRHQTNSHDTHPSTSTTPPVSPPPKSIATAYTKPPPVFKPPPNPDRDDNGLLPGILPARDQNFKLPMASAYSHRPPIGIGLQPFNKGVSPTGSGPLTQSSVVSSSVFDSQPRQSWETAPTSEGSQPNTLHDTERCVAGPVAELDEAWVLDQKLASTNQHWTPFNAEDEADGESWSTNPSRSENIAFGFPFIGQNQDAMTWDSWPTETQREDNSGPLIQQPKATTPLSAKRSIGNALHASEQGSEGLAALDVIDLSQDHNVQKPTEDHLSQRHSQKSSVSTADESQSVSFIGQATKFVSGMFGVVNSSAKKDKGQVKSLQLAASAAKKHQEEQDKKNTRLKDMEARRQAVLQRKADEERQKADEEERKAKEEIERRRKEREDVATKRLVKVLEKKANPDDIKKKVVVDSDKAKLKEKKLPVPTKVVKPLPVPSGSVKSKPLIKQPSAASLIESSANTTTQSVKGKEKSRSEAETEPDSKATKSTSSLRPVAGSSKPSHADTVQEWIDLPEPNSEYSNSDDDDNGKTYDVADWAMSPVLMDQLSRQQTMDPDDIFGPIRPLRMEEMFRTRQSRFRARTSSANWSGPDGLTETESREYARRMGFR